MMYARLRKIAGDVEIPDRVLSTLQRAASARAAMALFLTAEMAVLDRALTDAGIDYLVLKGPSLAEAYGSLAHRPFVDNDILIRRADYERLDALLREIGFHHRVRAPLQRLGYLYIHGEDTFARRTTGQISTVDVHTALVPPGFSFAPSLSTLLERGRRMPIGGAHVPVLSWDDLLLTLAINGLKDQWHRLRLAADVAAVAGMVTDWPAVLDRARKGRCQRILFVALLLASTEAEAVLPPEVLAAARADHEALRLAEWLSEHLARVIEGGRFSNRERARLNLQSQDGFAQQVRYTAFVALRRLTEWYVDPQKSKS